MMKISPQNGGSGNGTIGTTILSVVGHIAYAVAFSTKRVVTAYDRARRWIDAGLGVFFTFAGVKLLTSRT